jgi:hypothetical protein
MDYPTAGWALIALVWLALALYVLWLVWPAWKDRLARCPETSAVTLIRIRRVARPGMPSFIDVEQCGLWPDKQACLRTCLVRRSDIPRLRTDSRGLQPF